MPLLYVMSMGNGYISPVMIWKRNHSSVRMMKNEKEQTPRYHESALSYTIMMQIKMTYPQGERFSIPMQVVGIFSNISGESPDDTVYLDFEGNEGDVWEEEVGNMVLCKKSNVCRKD